MLEAQHHACLCPLNALFCLSLGWFFYSYARHPKVLATKLPSLLLVTHLCLSEGDGDFIPSLWTLSLKGVPRLQDP